MILFSEHKRDFQKTLGAEWYGHKTLVNTPCSVSAPFWIEVLACEYSTLMASFNTFRSPDFRHCNFLTEDLNKFLQTVQSGNWEPDIAGVYLHDHQAGVTGFKLQESIFLPNSSGLHIYGHWLLDILPSLVATSLFLGHKFPVFIDKRLPKWTRDLVLAFGFDVCDELSGRNFFILSGMPRFHDYLNVDIFNIYKNYIKRHFATDVAGHAVARINGRSQRIYISRGKLDRAHRRMTNSAEAVRLFEAAGFEVIFPEDFNIQEQIRIFQSATVVAGEAGSALHNSVFSDTDLTVISLQSARQNHFIQSSMCARFGQKSITVFAESKTSDWSSDFTVDLRSCEDALSDLAF